LPIDLSRLKPFFFLVRERPFDAAHVNLEAKASQDAMRQIGWAY
jgi:hypothetical protein